MLSRVDKQKRNARYEIEYDPTTGHPTTIRFIMDTGTRGLKGGRSDDLFRSMATYKLSNYGSVRSLDIPKKAQRFLR